MLLTHQEWGATPTTCPPKPWRRGKSGSRLEKSLNLDPGLRRRGNSWNTLTTVQSSSEIIIFTIMSKNPRGQFAQSPCRIYTAPLG